MSSVVIKDADIGLHSVNMLDTFVDLAVYKYKNDSPDKDTDHLIDLLNKKLVQSNMNNVIFSKKSLANKIDYDVKRSEGSIAVTREKEYLVYAKFEDLIIDQNLCSSFVRDDLVESKEGELSLENYYLEVTSFLKEIKLCFVDIEAKFGVFGEVIFFGRMPLRNEKISVANYQKLCNFVFKFVRRMYRERLSQISSIYVEGLLETHFDKKSDIKIMDTLHNDYISNEGKPVDEEILRRCLHSFTWSHHIFDTDLYNNSNFFTEFKEILKNEVDFSETSIIYSRDTKIYIGWSHSVFLTKNLNEDEKRLFVHFYKVPIEVEWGEWEFLRSLNKKVDKALFESFEMLENNNSNYKTLRRYKNLIDKFYYLTQRIIKMYDGLSMTVNPTQLKLIEVQRSKWKLDINKDGFNKNLESLKDIITYLSLRKTEENSRILNSILFVIALLSVIDISNTIYNIINTGNPNYMISTLMPASTLLVILMAYLGISKK